ncbi:MAG: transposase [Candidatus Bipolaricaulia bacterium]
METIECKVGSSTITLNDEELVIIIPRKFWTKRQWGWLVNIMTQLVIAGLAWVTAPVTIRQLSDSDRPMPRWKQMAIDGLSYLLFVLMIPSDHPLRQLYAAYDWHKVDEKCAPEYKNQKKGAPAYPPQVLFRILVLMFQSGTLFESQTLQRLQTDVAWRWFVGLSLLHPIPNAGTLSYFRSRLGEKLFEEILIDLIQACEAAGLVSHIESFYDMTGVEANATQVTPYQRAVILAKAVSVYLDKEQGGIGIISEEQIAAIVLEVLQAKHPSLKKVNPAQIVRSQKKLDEELDQPGQEEPNWWRRVRQGIDGLRSRLTETPASLADLVRDVARELIPSLPQAYGNPDAAVGHTRTDGTLCGYKSGFLVDVKCWIITVVMFIAVNKPEAPTVVEALDKHYAIFARYPENLGLDSAFDRDEVHSYTEPRGIYTAVTVRGRSGPAGVYHSDAFIWGEDGELRCPNGEVMERVAGPYKDGTDRYRSTGECSQCPFFEQCLTAKQRQKKENPRRELKTNTAAHQRAQRNRERSRSPKGRAIRKRRFASEGLFGHLNTFHNGDKAPYRNGEMDHIAQLMVAFVSNLEKLAAHA